MNRSPSVLIQYSQFSTSATWIFHWSNLANLTVAQVPAAPAPMAHFAHLMYTPNSFCSSMSFIWNHSSHFMAMPQSTSFSTSAVVHWSSALLLSPSSVCLNVFHHTWYLNLGGSVTFVTMIWMVTPLGHSGMRRVRPRTYRSSLVAADSGAAMNSRLPSVNGRSMVSSTSDWMEFTMRVCPHAVMVNPVRSCVRNRVLPYTPSVVPSPAMVLNSTLDQALDTTRLP
mmetsp:Transcript_26995/g.66171  ORF Transcript_26995/g.66171 Transcript_26995/m.66171 type:complete len:226 (-) Transcript_26995:590-1267(-)